MSIPNESTSSQKIIHYARYHRAALGADPAAAHLAPAISDGIDELAAKAANKEQAVDALITARALNDGADVVLDELCRECELDVLKASKKDRGAPAYRAAFPQGLSALVASRGEAQARQVTTLVGALREHLPDLAAAYEERLNGAASKATSAEAAVADADDEVSRAFTQERLARSALIEQLHANRGGLRVLYPRELRRRRSFFPDTRRRAVPEPEELDAETDADASPDAP